MKRFFSMMVLCCISISLLQAEPKSHVYRDFWYPMYRGERLSYCLSDSKACGLPVAHDYCREMGYARSFGQRMDHNVGLTNYLQSPKQCKGWQCDGFMFISCEDKLSAQLASEQFEDKQHIRQFVYPRMNQYRVDWCYEKSKACGRRAAYSFCRQIGYDAVIAFKKQSHIAASKALGDGALCFGDPCNGFESITCRR